MPKVRIIDEKSILDGRLHQIKPVVNVSVNSGIKHKKYSCGRQLSLNDMIDIVSVVDIKLKGIPVKNKYSKKVINIADTIISLSRDEKTKNQADVILQNMNKKIILENEKKYDENVSKRLYHSLMKG